MKLKEYAEIIGYGVYIAFCIMFFPLALFLHLVIGKATLEEVLEDLDD